MHKKSNIYSAIKTEYTDAQKSEKDKSSKITAQSSQPTCKTTRTIATRRLSTYFDHMWHIFYYDVYSIFVKKHANLLYMHLKSLTQRSKSLSNAHTF